MSSQYPEVDQQTLEQIEQTELQEDEVESIDFELEQMESEDKKISLEEAMYLGGMNFI